MLIHGFKLFFPECKDLLVPHQCLCHHACFSSNNYENNYLLEHGLVCPIPLRLCFRRSEKNHRLVVVMVSDAVTATGLILTL